MSYSVFKDNQNLTDKQKTKALQNVVEDAAYKIFYQCSANEENYRHNNDRLFSGVTNMLAVVDNDVLKQEVFAYIMKTANEISVERANKVDNYEVIYGKAYNPEEETVVKNNVNAMKDQIFKLCDEVKDDVITKFDLIGIRKQGSDVPYAGDLVTRVKACIKDHDYKILSAEDKIQSKVKYLTGFYPEHALKEFVRDVYEQDIKDQLKCAQTILTYNVNEDKYAIHDEFKSLKKYVQPDVYGQARSYGLNLSEHGKTIFNIKHEMAQQLNSNIDTAFNIFYASVAKHIGPHVQNVSKMSMIDKIKNLTSGHDDIASVIATNERLNIQNPVAQDQQNKVKFKI